MYRERERDVCTMIIAFIIALCLNKCKLQAYVLGNTLKPNRKQDLKRRWKETAKSREPIRTEVVEGGCVTGRGRGTSGSSQSHFCCCVSAPTSRPPRRRRLVMPSGAAGTTSPIAPTAITGVCVWGQYFSG